MGIIESPIFWIILAAASEVLAAIPNEKVKSNSLVQLIVSAANALLATRKGK
jgi:hypothetical protein|tara:strand:- start:21 stop:176 length:156 start_codon:yes stop_codon:yes gene_type:complete